MSGPVILILGSGPNAVQARDWPRAWFDEIVVMNNAWRVRPDWDTLVFPEDFPAENMPARVGRGQRLVEADAFVPAQNRYGGFVFAGATMAYTTAYWALDALKPRVMAFMGCDMVYPKAGDTHFYGTGAADPLRDDVSLRDLRAKSARLAALAAVQGCACVNLSGGASSLLFPRATADALGDVRLPGVDARAVEALRSREAALGYDTPDGRYDATGGAMDIAALDAIDAEWRGVWR
ncbi:MAG: hypothetical protein AB8B60_11060 [Sulfitobacter sp.]